MDPQRIHLVQFVHSQSYTHLFHNYPSGDARELPQGPLGVPGPHFENQWNSLFECDDAMLKLRVFQTQLDLIAK